MAMSTTLGRQSNMYKKNAYRSEISQAWCPAHIECCVSVGKPAQLRRAILLKRQLLRMKLSEKRLQLSELFIAIGERLSTRTPASLSEHVSGTGTVALPVTPRVRILETIDLSSSDIEHFLGEDAIVPVTPKLSALAPVAEIQIPSSAS